MPFVATVEAPVQVLPSHTYCSAPPQGWHEPLTFTVPAAQQIPFEFVVPFVQQIPFDWDVPGWHPVSWQVPSHGDSPLPPHWS